MKSTSLFCAILLVASLTMGQDKETTPIKPVAPKPPVSDPAVPETDAPAGPPQAEPIPEQTKPVEPVEKKPETYVVKKGDNPWTIAKIHGVELAELMKVNEIEDAKNLKIGDVLILPEGVKSKNPEKPKAPVEKVAPKEGTPEEDTPEEDNPEEDNPEKDVVESVPEAGDDWAWHTVEKGENPWTIAKKLKVDHQKIMSLNEGVDFRSLSIGQKIKVPKK